MANLQTQQQRKVWQRGAESRQVLMKLIIFKLRSMMMKSQIFIELHLGCLLTMKHSHCHSTGHDFYLIFFICNYLLFTLTSKKIFNQSSRS